MVRGVEGSTRRKGVDHSTTSRGRDLPLSISLLLVELAKHNDAGFPLSKIKQDIEPICSFARTWWRPGKSQLEFDNRSLIEFFLSKHLPNVNHFSIRSNRRQIRSARLDQPEVPLRPVLLHHRLGPHPDEPGDKTCRSGEDIVSSRSRLTGRPERSYLHIL
jgi:hypothetical protein